MDDFKTLLSVKKSMQTNINMEDESITVMEGAKSMLEKQTDSILVLCGGEIKGIVTEADIVRKVVALGKDSASMRLAELMNGPVLHIESDVSIFEAKKIMGSEKVGHLLIKEEGKVVGMISARDLVKS